MDGVTSGSAPALGGPRGGWFVGRFIDADPFRQAHDVEVKWGAHRKGETNRAFAANKTARTMSVLVRGRFRLTFRRGDRAEDVRLEKEGDFALWLPGLEHTWVAEEDSVVLTVRWPSVADDQVQRPA